MQGRHLSWTLFSALGFALKYTLLNYLDNEDYPEYVQIK